MLIEIPIYPKGPTQFNHCVNMNHVNEITRGVRKSGDVEIQYVRFIFDNFTLQGDNDYTEATFATAGESFKFYNHLKEIVK